MSVDILIGDCRQRLAELPDGSVHCCVTSPPYFGLRDYGHAGQMGLEPTPDEFVAGMVEVFREVRRVLRDDGTLWLNIGDTYAGGGNGGGGNFAADRANWRVVPTRSGQRQAVGGCKAKDLVGIPWLLAFALRADGWYLRQDIIWSKPNPMPESVRDRCTKAHEYLFLLSKSPKYYFDQGSISEPISAASIARLAQNVEDQAGSDRVPGKTNGPMKAVRGKGNRKTFRGGGVYTQGRSFDNDAAACNDSIGNEPSERDTRNRRSVWEVATQPFSEAHFATYPPALIEPCILAGCPSGGTVLDPFFGAGTTGLVADRLQRNCIGIELNPEYAEIARRRIADEAGMFGEVKAA
jgi:DNA modification methylase